MQPPTGSPVHQARSICVACGGALSADPQVLGGLSVQASPERVRSSWLGLTNGDFFSYYRCSRCGTLNVREYPDEHLLAELYGAMPANMAGTLSTGEQQANQRAYAHRIARAVPQGPGDAHLRLLELGSDCGWLLRELMQTLPGRIGRFAAVEPNQDVVVQLKAAIAATNAPAHHFATLEAALQHEGDGLDLVIAIHVLDHLFELNELFATLRSRLSRQGMIFMVVHHPGSLLARVLGKRWPPYCPQHPQLFTPKGVRCLARRHGMAVVNHGRTWNRFPLAMILNHFSIPAGALGSIPLLAPLGNRYYSLKAQ